jgi:adrenodoxin-NADP+ reductase
MKLSIPPTCLHIAGETEDLSVELVLVSIGYRSLPVQGAPFDSSRGIIPNQAGRVHKLEAAAEQKDGKQHAGKGRATEPGLYVCGWLKRGPTGIIGTNAVDAEDTVASIVEDLTSGDLGQQQSKHGAAGLQELLDARGVHVVDLEGWQRIDAAELTAGRAAGKVREKVVDVQEMLKLARHG